MINRLSGTCVILLFYIIPFQDLGVSYLFAQGAPNLFLKFLLVFKELIVLLLGLILMMRIRVSVVQLSLTFFIFYSSLFIFISEVPLTAGLIGFRTYALLFFSFLLGQQLVKSEDFENRFFRHLGVIFWLVFMFSVLEYFVLPSSIWKHPFPIMEMKREVANLSTANEYYNTGMPVNAFGEFIRRMLGPFDEPLYMAYFTVIIFNFYVAQILSKAQIKASKLKMILCSILIFLTQTRAIILGFVLSLFGIVFKANKVKTRPILFGLGALVIVVLSITIFHEFYLAFFNSIFTTGGRNIAHIMAYVEGFENLLEAPLGRGIGVSSTILGIGGENLSTENAFINIGLEIGIFGMLFILATYIYLLFRFKSYLTYKYADHTSSSYIVVAAAFMLLIQYIFAGFVAPHILTARILIPFMIIIGWAYAITIQAKRTLINKEA